MFENIEETDGLKCRLLHAIFEVSNFNIML
jgi:hypothetical protein